MANAELNKLQKWYLEATFSKPKINGALKVFHL